MTYITSNVCVIGNLVCMGCCGRDYKNKKSIEIGIKKNTLEYLDYKDNLEGFRDRKDAEYLRDCGICRNLIFIEDGKKVICPLHPVFNKEKDKEKDKEKNKGKDLREGHCEIEYLCKTAFLFDLWEEEKQKKFLEFIKSKKLDWYSFSMGMDKDTFLEEFELKY